MSRARWLTVAVVPVAVCAVVLAVEVGVRNWAALPRPIVFGAIVDTLLLNTLLVIVGAPVAGVTIGSRRGNPVVPLLLLTGAFAGGSALVCFAGWGSSAEATRAIVASHLTLASAALALSGIGACCAQAFRHPLDAVACSLGVSLVAAGAILLGGPSLGDAPQALIAGGLLASPLVTTAAAADVDLFRTSVLYQVSPLAHVRLDYPAWPLAAGLYLLVALACCVSARRMERGALFRSSGRPGNRAGDKIEP